MIIHSISLKEKPFMVALTAGTTVLGKNIILFLNFRIIIINFDITI